MLTATDIAKMKAEAKTNVKEARELAAALAPLIAGKHPGVQSAALAELVTTWLCGHHPKDCRGMFFHMWVGHVLDLVKIEQMKRGE